MAKVSKNIKNFRTEAELTQDALAEKINVTRQTVSSWENGRTQPDIEMLELLSNALNVGIEELIYGEKHKVGLEPEKNDNRKIIALVLAVLGSVLTVAGLIITFIVIWEEMPSWVLPSLMFVPLLAGACVAAYAHTKKKSSVAWCEGASVAWVAGLAATTAIVVANCDSYIRSFDTGYILTGITLLILPIAFTMNSLSGLIAFSGSAVWWSMFMLTEKENLPLWLIGTLLFLACGFIFTVLTDKHDIRRRLSFTVNLLACGFVAGYACSYFSDNPLTAAVCFVASFFVALYAADKGTDSAYPFRFVAVPLLTFFSTFISYSTDFFCDGDGGSSISFAEPVIWVMLVTLALGILSGKSSFEKNPLKITFCISSTVSVITQIAYSYLNEHKYFLFDLLDIIAMAAAVVSATVLIIRGVKTARMSTVNLGLISLFAVIISALMRMDFDLIVYGVVCIIMGIILLVINSRMSRTFKAKEGESNA